MRKLLTLPLIAVLAFAPNSCTVIQSARDQLAEMTVAEYQELNDNVYIAGYVGGLKLKEALLLDKPELREEIRELALELHLIVEQDQINVDNMVNYLMDRFADDLELEERYQEYIRDASRIIDAAVGQIRLGIDGVVSEREKGLALSLLQGLANGIV